MTIPDVAEGIRTAVRAVSDPCEAVRRWKALSGRKAIGLPFRFPVPEIFHCVGMLPVIAGTGEEPRSFVPSVDEWVGMPDPFPEGLEGALDWVESLAEKATDLSGEFCADGALDNSIRIYRNRDMLVERLRERCSDFPRVFDPGTLERVIDSGRILPVETHRILLAGILGEDFRSCGTGETWRGDPLLFLARRVLAGIERMERDEHRRKISFER